MLPEKNDPENYFSSYVQQENETTVLDPRPKLPRFHMPGLATRPWVPNKEAWGRQRKEAYYTVGTCHGKRQSKHSAHPQPSSEHRHELQV
jgi:hypothetical protein